MVCIHSRTQHLPLTRVADVNCPGPGCSTRLLTATDRRLRETQLPAALYHTHAGIHRHVSMVFSGPLRRRLCEHLKCRRSACLSRAPPLGRSHRSSAIVSSTAANCRRASLRSAHPYKNRVSLVSCRRNSRHAKPVIGPYRC